MPNPRTIEAELVDQALTELVGTPRGAPSGPAVRGLVSYVRPTVHKRVGRVLLNRGLTAQLLDLRAATEDHIQQIMNKLFEPDFRVLRAWDPTLGMGLKGWVGQFAQRRTIDALNLARHRRQFEELPTDHDVLSSMVVTPSSATEVEARDLWERAVGKVYEEASERGQRMLKMLFKEDRSTQEVVEAESITANAVYQWRNRLHVALREAVAELVLEDDR